MTNLFDHLIHAVRRPEDAQRTFEEELRIQTVQGGDHPQWGTYNALAYFGLSYVEFIGLKDGEKARETAFGKQIVHQLAVGEGAVQFALRTDEIDAIASQWQASGRGFQGPIEASRTRPDGSTLRWKMLFPEQRGDFDFKLPFFIQWNQTDEERARNLTQAAPDGQGYQIKAVHSLVRERNVLAERWKAYFQEPIERVKDEIRGEGIFTRVGDVELYFWAPSTPWEEERIRLSGERPFQLDLLATDSRAHISSEERNIHGLKVRILRTPRVGE